MNWKLAYFLKFWETSTNANFLPYLSPNPILSLIPSPNHLFLSHTFHSFYHHHQMLDSEILRITRQTDKKQIIFYHDKGINFPVEKEFQQLWRNTSVDGLQDDNIEEYLNKQVRVVNGRLLHHHCWSLFMSRRIWTSKVLLLFVIFIVYVWVLGWLKRWSVGNYFLLLIILLLGHFTNIWI